ncbi:putative E3 ubiquitin-protein ligase HERC2 [Symbiodinium microadriaticum]|uniref:Putative E3 ubiquitin-protein ligase HERC2 n=1 Tax=Symbiodinium microadriaticum TaxID=2951 RepID=A0A1Q9F609_SYMMI|nr:putative E3 ubiquitin-protein ligase HERC2 [Symbiodinium microadriaticum]
MSISVDVHLLSGERAAVEVEADASVESLKHCAQSALAVPSRGRLLNSSGEVLDGAQTVTEADLRSGDVLTLHVNQVQIQARKGAFAAILGDGSVVTWGNATFGGDSSAVQEQLRDVQQIQASYTAFAAILGDGSVVTWGHADYGGDSSAVQEQLRDVQLIQASFEAFAAILGDGSVVTWGSAHFGGDSSAVQEQLRDVQQIQASYKAFAAILGDGSVVTWGHADYGGDSSAVQEQLRDVQLIQASFEAFAAILGDGSVVTWGSAHFGGDSSAVQEQLRDVQQIQASYNAFAAILGDGSVVTWGDARSGGDSSAVQEQLRDVQQIRDSFEAVAAILGDAQEQWQLIEKQALRLGCSAVHHFRVPQLAFGIRMIRNLEQELERFKAELVLLKARRQAQRQRLATRCPNARGDDTQAKMIPKPTLLILTTTALSLILTVMNNLLNTASQQSAPSLVEHSGSPGGEAFRDSDVDFFVERLLQY